MKKILISAAVALVIAGCGNYTGDTINNSTQVDYSYYFLDNSVKYGSGTVLHCNDSTCSVDGSVVGKSNDEEGDAVVGEYDPTYTQAECEAAGFFYCVVDDKCMNQRVDDSSSSCNN